MGWSAGKRGFESTMVFLLGVVLIEPSFPAVDFKCQILFIFPVKDPHNVLFGLKQWMLSVARLVKGLYTF